MPTAAAKTTRPKAKSTSRKSSATRTAKPATAAEPPAPKTPREQYADWPVHGGDDRPQPWKLSELGINPAEVGPGEVDTLSPVETDHGMPILTAGSADSSVLELARRLAKLGYDSSVTRGENPFLQVDQTVLGAVEQFRRDYGVQEDPAPFGGDNEAGRAVAATHIGPFTWAALIRVSDRV